MFTKNATLLGLFCFAVTYATTAQTAVHSLSCGYNARIEMAVPQSANTWLVGGFGEPVVGAFYEDTLFLA